MSNRSQTSPVFCSHKHCNGRSVAASRGDLCRLIGKGDVSSAKVGREMRKVVFADNFSRPGIATGSPCGFSEMTVEAMLPTSDLSKGLPGQLRTGAKRPILSCVDSLVSCKPSLRSCSELWSKSSYIVKEFLQRLEPYTISVWIQVNPINQDRH